MDRIIDIDTEGIRAVRKKLDEIASYRFPSAIRSTLNDLSFDVMGARGKTGTIARSAKSEFDHERNKSFIKSMSGVDTAKGKNIDDMVSEVGIVKVSGKDRIAEGLEQQEIGGSVNHRYVPLKNARTSKSELKKVTKRSKHKQLDTIDASNLRGSAKMQAIITASVGGKGVRLKGRKGRRIILKSKKRGTMFFEGGIEKRASSNRMRGKNNFRVDMDVIYSENRSGVAKLGKSRPFVQKAGDETMKKYKAFLGKNIAFQLNKIKK